MRIYSFLKLKLLLPKHILTDKSKLTNNDTACKLTILKINIQAYCKLIKWIYLHIIDTKPIKISLWYDIKEFISIDGHDGEGIYLPNITPRSWLIIN